jgi:DNA-binding CsgD family transcriptional regulator
VLDLIASGASSTDIVRGLFVSDKTVRDHVSDKTVRNHVTNIFARDPCR